MKILSLFLALVLGGLEAKIALPEAYPSIVEQLIYYKDDHFKVFYGGPIDNGTGVQWIMPALFEDHKHRARAVYEISFINCAPDASAQEAELVYMKISDIDIKFQNVLCEEYKTFSALINNTDHQKKYILIREVDVSNVYYPEIFIASVYSDFKEGDRDSLLGFLKTKFRNVNPLQDLNSEKPLHQKRSVELQQGLIEQKRVAVQLEGQVYQFNVDHTYLDEDPWKSYYIVTAASEDITTLSKEEEVCLRLDSGCTSGQIYNDNSCDCLDQLHQGLLSIVRSEGAKTFLIHIPAHDGRGFGLAPKAETEIYKRGGVGRVNRTEKLDTVQAAILLYRTSDFDIRSYNGCAKILSAHKISSVELLTDNKLKMQGLVDNGIGVKRHKTCTEKETCLNHIKAKKNSKHYFAD